jgi:DNA-binding NarL/FixJ family response regulator
MRVFVVDDTPEVRKRLVALLRRIPSVTVVGEADSMRAAVDAIGSVAMDVMLLDLQLGDSSGLSVLAAVKSQFPSVRVIMISNFANGQYRQASLAAGADVFLDKSHELRRLPEILRDWAENAGSRSTTGADDVRR